MKVHVHFGGMNQTVEANSAEELLRGAKAEAAQRAPFLLRGVVKSMSDMQFAAEAVKRANAASGHNDPAPRTAQDFLDWAERRGYITVLEK